MRARLPTVWALVAAALLMAACLPGVAPPAASPEAAAGAAVADAGTDPPESAGTADAVASSQPASLPPSEPPPLPAIMVGEARACAARGGTLRPHGAPGLWTCVRVMADAGQACTSGAQCTGQCLARSGSCAPLEPLFGCHEVLDGAGRLETLCRH